MKAIIPLVILLLLQTNYIFSQGAAINSNGNAPHPSALLDLNSTSQGLLIPRMTTNERNGIISPADGLMLYNTSTQCFEAYISNAWKTISCPNNCNTSGTSSIAGSTSVCQGTNNEIYSVNINGATSYFWFYSGTGVSISEYSNPVSVSFNIAATSGILTVIAPDTCGNGLVSSILPITVNPLYIADVSITSSNSGSVCAGDTVIFTAHPVNGGASPTYKWFVNGIDAGVNHNTFSYTPVNNDTVICQMSSSYTICIWGSPVTSNNIIMQVNAVPLITNVSPGTRNGPGTVSLGATASSGSINWYNTPTGGTIEGTGTSFTTPFIGSTTIYYVEATLNGCNSPSRTPVTATIRSFPVDNSGTLTNDLVSYWKLDGNANDAWGNNNGSGSSVSYGTNSGKLDQGADLNGTNSRIIIPHSASLSISGAGSHVSLSAWVYIKGGTFQWIIRKGYEAANGSEWGMCVYDGAGGNYHAGFRAVAGAGRSHKTTTPLLAPNTWYLIQATCSNGATLPSIYVNGVQQSLTIDDPSSGTYNFPATGNAVNFGSSSNGTQFFNGYIDEVGIWKKILTQQEVNDLWNSGAGQTIQ